MTDKQRAAIKTLKEERKKIKERMDFLEASPAPDEYEKRITRKNKLEKLNSDISSIDRRILEIKQAEFIFEDLLERAWTYAAEAEKLNNEWEFRTK